MSELHEKPCAGEGLTSYRYKAAYGYIMIGAKTHADALSEAARSLETGRPGIKWLDVWNGERYVPALYNKC